jgi:hypothetical protein
MNFKEITDKNKYLKKHYPFIPVPKLDDKKFCIHCQKEIIVGNYKVEIKYNFFTNKNEEYICCPNAPLCDGTVIDWFY